MNMESRFCSKAEANHSPTEGESTALIEEIEKTAYFTLGCASVSVGTDYKPLIPIINGTDLSSVKTPQQHRLREWLPRWDKGVLELAGSQAQSLLSGIPSFQSEGRKIHWRCKEAAQGCGEAV